MASMAPNQRYAIIGKSRSGKTHFTVVLAHVLVPAHGYHDDQWQIWWLDSKMDREDKAMLWQWGYREYDDDSSNRKWIPIRKLAGDTSNDANEYQSQQVQEWCFRATARQNVLIVIDEYAHVVKSTLRAGPGITEVHRQGGGLNVGIIGETQEPVGIPRQLISQANHIFLFDLSYVADIDYVRKFCPEYVRPSLPPELGGMGDNWGLFSCDIDGKALWVYHRHVAAWHDTVLQAA